MGTDNQKRSTFSVYISDTAVPKYFNYVHFKHFQLSIVPIPAEITTASKRDGQEERESGLLVGQTEEFQTMWSHGESVAVP